VSVERSAVSSARFRMKEGAEKTFLARFPSLHGHHV
jgi:hypothetical protein